jgi:hypothetical protein
VSCIFRDLRLFVILAALPIGFSLARPLWAQDSAPDPIPDVDSDSIDISTVVTTENLDLVVGNEADATEAVDKQDSKELEVVFGDWSGYNSKQSDTTWLAGGDFGMFSLESFPSLKLGQHSALVLGTGFHFLDGPVAPDMPPRLFDFQLAYHARKALSDKNMLDVRLGVGAFSDFEASARKGIRFPGHAVAYCEWSPQCVSVFGVEVLDRDDISLLPVGGIVWRPQKDLMFEFVFPRPKVQLRLDGDHAMYIGGELGGGTWAIQREDASKDNATYRDLRIAWGIIDFGDTADGVLEIGWALDRSLEYRSGAGNRDLDGALILRCHTHY